MVKGKTSHSLFTEAVSRPETEWFEHTPVVTVELCRCVFQPTLGDEFKGSVEIGGVSVSGP